MVKSEVPEKIRCVLHFYDPFMTILAPKRVKSVMLRSHAWYKYNLYLTKSMNKTETVFHQFSFTMMPRARGNNKTYINPSQW